MWNSAGGGALEAYNAANWTDYAQTFTEEGSTNIYVGNFPAGLPAGLYGVDARRQTTATPLVSDVNCGTGDVQWNGTKAVPLSDLATSGQIGQLSPLRLARGTQIKNFPLYFKSSADHVTPLTSGVVSGQIARDGGNFGPLQSGAFAETGMGYYNLQALTSGDLLADTVKLLFTASNVSGQGVADPVPLAFILQRSSGS